MSTLTSIIRKESLHIVRDRRTMLITIAMPLILLLLFGFAISTEVNNVRTAMVTDRETPQTREIASRLIADEYFTFLGTTDHGHAYTMLKRGEADAILLMRTDNGQMRVQIMTDATCPTSARAAAAYLRALIAGKSAPAILSTTLYNPRLKSAYNFVPGIMGMIFILICAIMTSVSIVGERETGTMDLLLVSPVRPATVIAGKLIPYFALSCLILGVMLTVAYTVLSLPFSSGVVYVVAVSLLYIILSLSIGLLVSTIVSNRVSALIVSAILFMLPVILLSGMIFPVDNMPLILQYISGIIPARWYIEAMRKLMIQQLGPGGVITETAVLITMTAAVLALAIRNFRRL